MSFDSFCKFPSTFYIKLRVKIWYYYTFCFIECWQEHRTRVSSIGGICVPLYDKLEAKHNHKKVY